MSSKRSRRRGTRTTGGGARTANYQYLKNPFNPPAPYSADRIQAMHEAALDLLENKGMKILLPEARDLFRAAGASVDEQMVYIGREIVESALATAPKRIDAYGGAPHRQVRLQQGWINYMAGSGAPNCSDRIRGRRPGSERDWRELITLHQHYDVLTMLGPMIEPQDVPINLRHYVQLEAQLTLSDKLPFGYARGQAQSLETFELLAAYRGLDETDFRKTPSIYTIVNTNSPRQLDKPMAQGLIDYARYGQIGVVTPFCLMGAMAPVTIAGALVLSHAEALSAIALMQLAKPGAASVYGAFVSNVDMRSGSPAFGTPEQVQANLVAGQMARLIGLPWRCASGSAANANDAQAAHETQAGSWGATLAGCSMLIHSAGWLEGGLVQSYEKMLTDLDMVMLLAELCREVPEDDGDLALDALDTIEPGGHFFAAEHTMQRYQSAFHTPQLSDWSNHGAWEDAGSKTVDERATERWQALLANPKSPELMEGRVEELRARIAQLTANGGAAILD